MYILVAYIYSEIKTGDYVEMARELIVIDGLRISSSYQLLSTMFYSILHSKLATNIMN